jgi:glyoxylase-like metal-dependent hydrolase (beta-lactamase superfamily II)
LVGTILVPSSDGDMNQYISDLYRIRELSPSMLFPGHGPLVANPERLLSRYIDHREERHNRVLEAVRSGRKRLEEIAKESYSDTPEANKMLSEDQTLSHLKSLMKSGLVSMSDDCYIAG